MPPATKTFLDDAIAVAGDFLHTAVVVDDESFKPATAEMRARIQAEAQAVTRRPGRRSRKQEGSPPEKTEDKPVLTEHDLDPKAIIDAFAREGLVCAVLSPQKDEDPSATLLPAARRADLVILDWVLHNDHGTRTKKLIDALLRTDEEPVRRRLRTIAIYTAQDDLHGVAAEVKSLLQKHFDDCKLYSTDRGLALERGPVRITVLAKATVALGPGLEDRQVSLEDLPRRMISEFSALCAGIVTGVALASLAALRGDAHKILQALPRGLDPSFVGHRTALANPDDAQEVLVELVVSELAAVLHDHDVAQHADQRRILRWLQAQLAEDAAVGEITVGEKTLTFGAERLATVIKKGLGEKDARAAVAKDLQGASDSRLREVGKRATELFAGSGEIAEDSDALLMERMMVRTRYARPPRRLTLGTLVRNSEGEYLLCVQPVCDSIRIGQERAFPFLLARKPRSGTGPDVVVRGRDGKPIKLTIPREPYALRLITCKGTGGVCLARQMKSELVFDTDSNPLVWIADLKEIYAQRFAERLATNFARLGLDEHEIMRLNREQ
jgi:hypothetical protein